jgi:hypothetical protein
MGNRLANSRQIFLARIHVIDTNNHNYTRVSKRISSRQEGCCRFCAKQIKHNDIIISKGHSKRSKYFHKECAERIHLLWEVYKDSAPYCSFAFQLNWFIVARHCDSNSSIYTMTNGKQDHHLQIKRTFLFIRSFRYALLISIHLIGCKLNGLHSDCSATRAGNYFSMLWQVRLKHWCTPEAYIAYQEVIFSTIFLGDCWCCCK